MDEQRSQNPSLFFEKKNTKQPQPGGGQTNPALCVPPLVLGENFSAPFFFFFREENMQKYNPLKFGDWEGRGI